MVEVCIDTFDLAGLPETGVVFDRLLALRPGRVVVDLSRCRHIDAAAIGLLLDVHRRLVRADGVLTIRNPNPASGASCTPPGWSRFCRSSSTPRTASPKPPRHRRSRRAGRP